MTEIEFTHHCCFFGEEMRTDLTEGVLDRKAEDVFTNGQCHSFALALAQELGTQVVILVSFDNWHCAAVFGDDGYADVLGCHAWGDEWDREIRVSADEEALLDALEGLELASGEEASFHPTAHEDARSFALAAIELWGMR